MTISRHHAPTLPRTTAFLCKGQPITTQLRSVASTSSGTGISWNRSTSKIRADPVIERKLTPESGSLRTSVLFSHRKSRWTWSLHLQPPPGNAVDIGSKKSEQLCFHAGSEQGPPQALPPSWCLYFAAGIAMFVWEESSKGSVPPSAAVLAYVLAAVTWLVTLVHLWRRLPAIVFLLACAAIPGIREC